jgi:hypothetical protein
MSSASQLAATRPGTSALGAVYQAVYRKVYGGFPNLPREFSHAATP